MPAQTNFYQRIFRRDFILLPFTHQAKNVVLRRHCSDRLCLILSFVLLFYIGWYKYTSSDRYLRARRDPAEELAYKQAINKSQPIIQNTQICSLDEVDILFIILSTGPHFLERQSIRETWGSMPDLFGVHSQRLFVIGYQSDGNFYRDLLNEAAHEQDLLYLTVSDHESSSKELHAYKWLDEYCPGVKYIFKTEDDLFVNSLILHELVRDLKSKAKNAKDKSLYNIPLEPFFQAQTAPNPNKFLFGWAYQPGKPERNLTISPYYVTYEEYSKETYPRYCSGFGYLMNSQTRNAIFTEGLKDKRPFRFSDIYMTGILPERLQFVCDVLPFTFHQGTTAECIGIIRKNNKKESTPGSPPLLICSTGRHTGQNSYSDYYKIWTELKHVYADRLNPTNNN